MGRLGLLIVLLAVVIAAAVVVQLRVAPEVALSPMAREAAAAPKLSGADQKRLEVLQANFVKERDAYLQMRTANGPKDKLNAQQAKATAAAQAVVELGGQSALKSVGKSKYAPASKPGEKSASQGGDPPGETAEASCSGESCSTEGGTCTPSSAEKPAEKDAKAAKPAKAEAAAKPAAPKKP